MEISFNDTATAYAYKSSAALRNANFIFSTVNNPFTCSLATGTVKLGLKIGLPIEGIVKKTIFSHFCGGESISKSLSTVDKLGLSGVRTILDYSVEGGNNESGFDDTLQEVLKTIDNAANKKNIPFAVFKMTGLASVALLEKIQAGQTISKVEQMAFERISERVETICGSAHDYSVPVLIDAEETWIQDVIDDLAYKMMAKFNKKKSIVFNTYQLYRTESLTNLRKALDRAVANGFYLGAKLVRGAYMEKERERAKLLGYPSPIHADIQATNKAFNNALNLCKEKIEKISVICGSHNECSTQYLADLMSQFNIENNDPRIWFSQLYGMSDHISFNLAKAGYNVAKYLPYGPIKSVMPYLLRRAEENTSVTGQSSRELVMIRKEIKRRKTIESIS